VSSLAERIVVSVLLLVACGIVVAGQQQPTVFRSVADALVVEAQVVDGTGAPITGLTAADFSVDIAGRTRRVAWVDWVPFDGEASATPPTAQGAPPGTQVETPRRIFVLAVDEFSFTDEQRGPFLADARQFVTGLPPSDFVGLLGFPASQTFINPTRNRETVLAALGPALGVRTPPTTRFHFSPSEIIDASAGDREVINRIRDRECPPMDPACPSAIRTEARSVGAYLEATATQSLNGLVSLFKALAGVPGRKHVIVLSGGMLMTDRTGGHPDISTIAQTAGREAAAANVALYVLHADTHMLDQMNVRRGRGGQSADVRDSAQMAQGLDMLTGAAGGLLINVSAGTSESAYARVLRETRGVYLIGVEMEARERDGRTHAVRVSVTQSGATVRHRTTMVVK